MLFNCGLSRVPWTAKRSNQSTLKEISPEYSLERLMLKLKAETLATWCKALTLGKRLWCWERLRAGEEGEGRGWAGWMASLTQWTWVRASSGSWWWTGKTGMLQSMGLQRVRHKQLTWTDHLFLTLCGASGPNITRFFLFVSFPCMCKARDRGQIQRPA